MKDVLKDVAILLFVFFLGVFVATHARGQTVGPPRPIKFCDVCLGFTVSKRGTDVLIRCPGQPLANPWMTIKECHDPKVDRSQPNNVAINCSLQKSAQAASKSELVLHRDMRPMEEQQKKPVLMACVN